MLDLKHNGEKRQERTALASFGRPVGTFGVKNFVPPQIALCPEIFVLSMQCNENKNLAPENRKTWLRTPSLGTFFLMGNRL